METVAPFKEVIDEIKQAGGDAFRFCFQCGLCDAVCPWNRFGQFSICKIIREAAFGLTERRLKIEGEPDTVAAILGDLVFRVGKFRLERYEPVDSDWWGVKVSYVERG